MAQAQAGNGEIAGYQHIIELFDSTESIIDTVSTFVREGLTQGDAVLVVMRLPQWNAIASELNPLLSGAIASGQLTVLDAARTLERIMWHRVPSGRLFDEVVGRTIRRIGENGGRLRIYCDMVDILAAEGNFQAACELEKLWSELVSRERMTLLCGYSATSFFDADGTEALRRISCSHSNVPGGDVRVPPGYRGNSSQSPV